MRMKERVYAWYPPATDVYKSHRETELDSYTKECLYRYRRSRFDDLRRCNSVREETSGSVQIEEPPTKGLDEVALKTSKISFLPRPPPGPSPPSVRSQSAVEAKTGMASPEPGPRRLQGAGCSLHTTRGRASSAWVKSKEWLAETSTSSGAAVKDPAPESTGPGAVLERQAPQAMPIPSPPASRLTPNGHAARVQSAVIRRPGSQVVKRSVQSAGPERQTATLVDPAAAVVGAPEKEEHVHRRYRPWGPTPLRWREEEDGERTADAVEGLGMEFPSDYDEQLKKYGWKMEVPGDPLGIKRGCFAKRLSTTVVIPVEEVARKPGRKYAQSSETFFYNTIPRMPMSFTIHPDWASEILQTKRMELKEKTGADGRRATCRMADFSFVY